MATNSTNVDVLAEQVRYEDLAIDEITQLNAELAELGAEEAQVHVQYAAKAQRRDAILARNAAAVAERQRAEQAAAAREAARIAEARAAEIAGRNAELTAEVVDQCDLAVEAFYTWLAAAPPVDGPVRIITRTDPNYRGAALAMITNCHDPRLRYCRIIGPAPLRFA